MKRKADGYGVGGGKKDGLKITGQKKESWK